MKRKEKADLIISKLLKKYPDARCELEHINPFQLLVATILSAQCTDLVVNKVTPKLFRKFPTPSKMAKAKTSQVETIIRPTGFFKNKSINIIKCAQIIQDEYDGMVPKRMVDLTTLPGVGRKTANVVLGNAFGINEGIVVDTHVKRISGRLKLTLNQDPVKIEKDLMKLFDQKHWPILSHLLIFHGRRVCSARSPNCDKCVLKVACSFRA